MSTSRCVRSSICWATSLIRSSETAVRAGHAGDPDPDHADRVGARHVAVVAGVLQGGQRGQRGDQVDRLADVAAQVLVRQQVAAVQRRAAGCVGGRCGDRLIGAERHLRQRVERLDLGRVEGADKPRAGDGAGEVGVLVPERAPRSRGTGCPRCPWRRRSSRRCTRPRAGYAPAAASARPPAVALVADVGPTLQ